MRRRHGLGAPTRGPGHPAPDSGEDPAGRERGEADHCQRQPEHVLVERRRIGVVARAGGEDHVRPGRESGQGDYQPDRHQHSPEPVTAEQLVPRILLLDLVLVVRLVFDVARGLVDVAVVVALDVILDPAAHRCPLGRHLCVWDGTSSVSSHDTKLRRDPGESM